MAFEDRGALRLVLRAQLLERPVHAVGTLKHLVVALERLTQLLLHTRHHFDSAQQSLQPLRPLGARCVCLLLVCRAFGVLLDERVDDSLLRLQILLD